MEIVDSKLRLVKLLLSQDRKVSSACWLVKTWHLYLMEG